MPLIIKDFSWSESKGEVILKLPLKGVKASKVDVVATETYVKASYPPYFFECFLFGAIKEEESSCSVGDGLVHFRLIKKSPDMWGRLDTEAATEADKEELQEMRDRALKEHKEGILKREKERAEKKREEERFAIKEQIRLNQEDRERIENVKQEERNKATEDMERWKTSAKETSEVKNKDKQPSEEDASRKSVSEEDASRKSVSEEDASRKSVPLWEEEELDSKPNPVRGSGKISVTFTPRILPTAARESKRAEEEEWLSKLAEARRIKMEGRDDKVEEKDPEALKEKGKFVLVVSRAHSVDELIRLHIFHMQFCHSFSSFFQHGDLEGAISAYTQAMALSPNLPSLYANRSACYLKKREFEHCIEDCHKALELFYPVVPGNHRQRVKVFARRGLAYAELGLCKLAIQDYDAALKLAPNDQQLKRDKLQLQELLLMHKTDNES